VPALEEFRPNRLVSEQRDQAVGQRFRIRWIASQRGAGGNFSRGRRIRGQDGTGAGEGFQDCYAESFAVARIGVRGSQCIQGTQGLIIDPTHKADAVTGLVDGRIDPSAEPALSAGMHVVDGRRANPRGRERYRARQPLDVLARLDGAHRKYKSLRQRELLSNRGKLVTVNDRPEPVGHGVGNHANPIWAHAVALHEVAPGGLGDRDYEAGTIDRRWHSLFEELALTRMGVLRTNHVRQVVDRKHAVGGKQRRKGEVWTVENMRRTGKGLHWQRRARLEPGGQCDARRDRDAADADALVHRQRVRGARRPTARVEERQVRSLGLDYQRALIDFERAQRTSLGNAGIAVIGGGGGGGAPQ